MKTKSLILFFTISIIIISCNKDEELESPDCVSFAEALVYFKTDSINFEIKRVIDILTPDDDKLKYLGVHEYHWE